jgi:hypothetical protein
MEVSGQLHASAALPLGEEPPVHIVNNGGVGPRAGLDMAAKKKSLAPTGNRTPALSLGWHTEINRIE